jgi:hypothetical protein
MIDDVKNVFKAEGKVIKRSEGNWGPKLPIILSKYL